MSERSAAPRGAAEEGTDDIPAPMTPETDDIPAPTTSDEADNPDIHAGRGFVRRHRRGITIAGSAVAVIIAFLAITGFTGLAAPGPFERYTYADLHALADEINANAGDLRTPDDCWRALTDSTGPLRDIAKVDYIRSRVVVRLYSRVAGTIDRGTRTLATREIDAIVAADPRFTGDMVEIEASPDGWSPTLSCRLATQGWVTGF